ncbi:hypothetical protein BH09VER1_BH09VER1_04320 [soil metagenome]
MSAFTVSLLVFCCVFGVGYLATLLREHLPEQHLTAETKDTVKLTMGLVGSMTALILGLLVASAKGTYDTQRGDVIALSAKFVLMDRIFAHYGPESASARERLHHTVESMIDRLWPDSKSQPAKLDPTESAGDSLYNEIEALTPKGESQVRLKNEAINSAMDVAGVRWLFYEQSGSAISAPLLAVVIGWLAVLSASFGLFAPANGTARAALLICALSVSGAIFLILELDQPFSGLIQVSKQPMEMALAHLGK